MASENNILLKTTERLGIHDDLLITKAQEFLRILQAKCSVKTLNESAKIILCLDLAATYVGTNFDRENGMKLSGLKKSVYQNNLHTVEKILELDKPVTVRELCVQLGCIVIKDLAESIFDKYKSSNNIINDMGHPQYAAASVYTACRLKHVKITMSQFVTASHLKPSKWKELTEDFYKFASSLSLVSPKKNKKNIDNSGNEIVQSIDELANLKNEPKEEECEPYEIWKKKILDEAYEALKSNEAMQE